MHPGGPCRIQPVRKAPSRGRKRRQWLREEGGPGGALAAEGPEGVCHGARLL